MKKQKSKNQFFLFFLTMMVAVCATIFYLKKETVHYQTIYDENITIQHTDALQVSSKRLENDGHQEIEFTYQILPEDANCWEISISLTWTNEKVEERIEDYLSYEHFEDDYKIIVTCLKKADYQAKMTLKSKDNQDAKAIITIDFYKDFLGYQEEKIHLHKKMTSMNESIFSKEEIQTTIDQKSMGFGKGTLYQFSHKIENFTLQVDEEKSNSYVTNDYKNGERENLYLEGAYYGNGLLIDLGSGKDSTFQNCFLGSDSENVLKSQDLQTREMLLENDFAVFRSIGKAKFDYYGKHYEMDFTLDYILPTECFYDYLYKKVDSVKTSIGEIIF